MKRSGFILKNFISLVENVPLDKRAFGIRLQEHGMYDNKHGQFFKNLLQINNKNNLIFSITECSREQNVQLSTLKKQNFSETAKPKEKTEVPARSLKIADTFIGGSRKHKPMGIYLFQINNRKTIEKVVKSPQS